MRQSDEINELAKALAAAQATMPNAVFNQQNPHFKSKYADMASVRAATVPHLSANGLSISQTPDYEGERYILLTTLLHISGQWKASVIPLLEAPDQPQKQQSALTTARRGGWSSICGVAVEDDDGNIASGHDKTISASQLDELMAIVHERNIDTTQILQPMSERLGYKVENLSQVMRGDMVKVRGWLSRSKGRSQ